MPNIPSLPTITSISATDPTVTDAGIVHYTVTFSEPVTGIAADKFSLVTSGSLAGASIAGVTPVAGSNGSSYVVAVNSGTGDGTLTLQMTSAFVRDADGYQVGPFQSETDYTTSAYGRIAPGDVNADGKPDLVSVGSASAGHGYISISLNANGAFAAPVTIDADSAISSVALSDVNGDGKLDLLYGRYNDGTLGARLGHGDGTFAAETKYAVGSFPRQIIVGDVNNDGLADAIVANMNSGTVSVLVGNGDGTFRTQTVYATGSAPSLTSNYNYMTTGDFNGDGKLDLAVLNSDSTSILLGNGDGTFQPRTSYGSGAQNSIVSGDFNGDGKIDLATLGYGTISVMIGGGDGTFATRPLQFVPEQADALAAADLNQDGKLDLVVKSASGVSILYGLGDGAFRPPVTLPGGGSSTGMSVADLNGDGKPDIVIPAAFVNRTTVLTSDPSNSAAPAYTIHRPVPALAITDAAVTQGTDGNNYINAAHFNNGTTTLSGVATAGDVITLTNPADNTVVGTTTADASGAWAINVSGLQDGHSYGYVASVTDGNGNTKAGPVFSFIVDTTAPVLSIVDFEPVDGSGKFNMMGTIGPADAGVSITINQQGTVALGGTVAGSDGKWILSNQTLPSDSYGIANLSAQATDAAGNTTISTQVNLRIVNSGYVYSSTSSANRYIAIGAYGLDVLAGGVLTNARVAPGAFVQVEVNGTATGTKVWSGGSERIYGKSTGSMILNGAIQHVYGTAIGTTVEAGGFRDISKGTATDTILYGNEQVLSGGTAAHTMIKAGGAQLVTSGGHATNTVVEALGVSQVAAGADEHGATIYGTQYLSGIGYGATIGANGIQYDYGKSYGALVQSAGVQHVYQGGSADGTTVAADGYQDVYQASVTNTVLNGQQQVLAGGSADATTINAGAWQFVGAGGATTHTTIGNGGVQYDQGTSSGALVQSGGSQHVYQGGSADGTNVAAGGYQDVYHGTATNTVLTGQQQVLEGGEADATIVNAGGRQYVGSGGATSGSTIAAGGFQYVDTGATDSGATINGGWQYVAGSASGATVSGRGQQDIAAGATATNSRLDGGTEHVYAGGRAQNVDFDGSAGSTLVLDAPAGLSGTIANFGADDYIDFRNTAISSVGVDSTNNLTVMTSEGLIYSWGLLGQYAASSFVLASDGNGGTALSYVPQQQTLLAAAH